jgi:membrane protein YdbS with pleckstrin-like domain
LAIAIAAQARVDGGRGAGVGRLAGGARSGDRLPPVAPKLHPGEQVLYEGHPSWRAILDFYIKGILATAVICLLIALATGTLGDSTDKGLVTIVALVGVALTILVGFIRRVATSYTITNRRLHIKRGIVSRTIQETRLERVQNVNYQQSVLQRALQIGDVDFDTAAGDDYTFTFEGVGEPADVVHMVDQATGVASPDGLGGEVAHPASNDAGPPSS